MALNRKQQIITAFVIALLGAYMLFPSAMVHGFKPLPQENYFDYSLDSSWLITLSYVNKAGLVWGKDFCFTYGPLAYLPMRRAWGAGVTGFLLYDLFYIINIFLIFYLSVKKSANKLLTILIIAATAIMLPTYLGGDSALIWFFILIFWLIKSLQHYKRAYLIPIVIITTLLFFLKFNTAFVSVVMFALTAGYLLIFNKDRIFIAGSVLVLPVLIWLCAVMLKVDLPGYIISGFEMVKGYNEIMYMETQELNQLLPYMLIMAALAVLVVIPALLIKKQVWHNREELLRNGLIAAIFCGALFILYKQSTVRADIYHLIYFFVYFSFLMLCLPGVFDAARLKNLKSIVVVALLAIQFYTVLTVDTITVVRLQEKISKEYYFDNLINFDEAASLKLFPNNNALPQNIVNTIGKSTVDVLPWNTFMLYENKLNYLPRPVMQSYTAYTKYLEDLNFEHYNSDKAPEYVIYTYHANDIRYPLFEEPKVNLVLLNNYEIAQQFTHMGTPLLLLKKKEKAKPVQLKFEREYAMYFGSGIIPKDDTYYEITLYNSIEGKLKSIFTHAPEVEMAISTLGNSVQTYRTSPALLKSGIFGKFIINNNDDFAAVLLQGKTDNDNAVAFYNFTGNRAYFKEKIRVKEYKIIY